MVPKPIRIIIYRFGAIHGGVRITSEGKLSGKQMQIIVQW